MVPLLLLESAEKLIYWALERSKLVLMFPSVCNVELSVGLDDRLLRGNQLVKKEHHRLELTVPFLG